MSTKDRNICKQAGRMYLVGYNAMQCAGWSYIFYLFLPHLMYFCEHGITSRNLYQDIAPSLKLFQAAAYLEVIHCIVGLVKSNPLITSIQVTSRVFVVFLICDNFTVSYKYYGCSTSLRYSSSYKVPRLARPPILVFYKSRLFTVAPKSLQ